MDTNKKQKALVAAFYCLFIALLAAGTFWDEQISRLLYYPDSLFGEFFRRIGEFPPYLTIPLFGTAFFYGKPDKLGKALSIFWKVFFTVITLAGFVFMMTKFGDYWIPESDYRLPLEIVIAVLLCVLSLLLGKYIPKHHLKALKKFSVFGILAFLVSALCVDGLKSVWGRVRPRDMLKTGDFSSFTPWYLPQGDTGNKSFPSGHANQAALLFIITGLSDAFSSLKKHETKLFLGSLVFSLLVAFSRLIVGAHFLTDVTAAILITFSVVYILRVIIFKKERTSQI